MGLADWAEKSIFSNSKAKSPGAWMDYQHSGMKGRIQGWKLHVSVLPKQAEPMVHALGPILRKCKISHKFLPLEEKEVKKMVRRYPAKKKLADAKTCTVYPRDPRHLATAIIFMEHEISTYETNKNIRFEPYHKKGLNAEYRVGKTNLLYIRYGSFSADDVWNPKTQSWVSDQRDKSIYPSFIRGIPDELR